MRNVFIIKEVIKMKKIDKLTEFDVTGFSVDYNNYNTIFIILKERTGEVNKNRIEGYIELTAKLSQLLEVALKNKEMLNKPVFDRVLSEKAKAMGNEELDNTMTKSFIKEVEKAGGWDKFLEKCKKKRKKSSKIKKK